MVWALNLMRRRLNESQRGMVGARIKPFYEKAAKARQLASLKKGQEQSVQVNLPEREKGQARDKAAQVVKVPAGRPPDGRRTGALVLRRHRLAPRAAARLGRADLWNQRTTPQVVGTPFLQSPPPVARFPSRLPETGTRSHHELVGDKVFGDGALLS